MQWLPARRVLERLAKQLIAAGAVILVIGIIGSLTTEDGTSTVAPAQPPATTAPAITTATTPAVSDSPTTSSPPEPTPTTSSPPTTEAPATTMTAAPAPTTTAAPTTTTLAPSQLIEDFVVLFALAIADGDADFLLNRLHPAVTGGFGPDLCLNWIETEILQLGDYELTGPVQGPQDRPFTTPAGTGTIEGAYSAPVSFVFQGQLFNAQGGFVLIGAEVNWLGQCR